VPPRCRAIATPPIYKFPGTSDQDSAFPLFF
jgi:hypothetical protein